MVGCNGNKEAVRERHRQLGDKHLWRGSGGGGVFKKNTSDAQFTSLIMVDFFVCCFAVLAAGSIRRAYLDF